MASEIAEHENERKRSGPVAFFREVRAEARKITWASRQETVISTIMVLIMVTIAAVFFFFADMLLGTIVQFVLGLNR
ncbi:MAG: preprotein translocase subunit SecE [Hyphomonadaceae bacterium]